MVYRFHRINNLKNERKKPDFGRFLDAIITHNGKNCLLCLPNRWKYFPENSKNHANYCTFQQKCLPLHRPMKWNVGRSFQGQIDLETETMGK